MDTSHARGPRPISQASPGRRAEELRPKGRALLLPFVHLLLAVGGMMMLLVPPVGMAMQRLLLRMVSVVGPAQSATETGVAAFPWWSVVPGWTLEIVGLVGLAHGENRERHRQRLIEDADRRATARIIEELRRAA